MQGFIDKMTFAPKTWGSEIWVVNSELYCGKILSLNKGGHCSYHYHILKDEVLMVTEGKVLFIYSSNPITKANGHTMGVPSFKEVVLNVGQAWHVTPGIIHQFYGLEDSKITEFSTQHFDEDSYRVTQKFIGTLVN